MNDVDKKEVWKDVVGYEGLYKVSNFGNVYSCYVNRNLKLGTHRDGYQFVILTKNKQKKIRNGTSPCGRSVYSKPISPSSCQP